MYIWLTLLVAAGCRSAVLERREHCPSLLYFQVFNAGAFMNPDRVHVSAFRYPDEDRLCSDTTTISALEGRDFCLRISRAETVQGSGVLGYRRCRLESGSRWTVAPGAPYDSLFRFSFLSRVEPERFIVDVEFVKEYSRVTLQFASGESFPFDVVVRSNTCGIDAVTGKPLEGPYWCRAQERQPGVFDFLLPRQADDALTLELYGRPGQYPGGALAHSIGLGSVLREQGGISWKEKNLPDVLVGIDQLEYDIQVQVVPWENENLEYAY